MTKKLTFISVFLGCFLVFIGIAYAATYLNVSLSPNTPVGGYISPTSTIPIAFTSFNFQNTTSSTENILLKKLAVTNSGTSSTTPHIFSSLYLYEGNNLIATTTTKISNSVFLFNNLNYVIPTSTVKTLTIKGVLGSDATSGLTIRLGIADDSHIRAGGTQTTSSTTIMGNFPIFGNLFGIY